ncbi:MAG: hypothetical protein OJF52_004481 [Nitrospira sp.]|jgi:hypothetical protein|nr:MAG: hypothetical protein OJF52_004481 [Nitrospira sp.]
MKVVSPVISRHGRLTILPACADMTLLIRRVAHLADRARSECARSMRAVRGTANPAVLRSGEAGILDARTLEYHGSLLILVCMHG